MRVRAACLIVLVLAGLLSCNAEQAAENSSKDNTPNVTNPPPSSPPSTPPPNSPPTSPPSTPPPLPVSGNVYSRMFPGLPSFASPTDEVREQAKKLGMKGGLLDALDNQPGQSNPDNPNMTEGVTFFGQFLDHDLTFALKAPLLEQTDPRRTTNFRTAKFDLDSMYGNGPDGSPELYETGSGDIKFRIEAIPDRSKSRGEAPCASTSRAIPTTTRLSQIAGTMKMSSSANSTWQC